MAEQSSKNYQIIPSNLDTLNFDSFGRNPLSDIVCVTPVRTIVRREEEIVLIRRVRKVEEIDASPACPVNTNQLGGGQLIVYAKEEDRLPTLINQSDKTIRLDIEVLGQWNYGGQEDKTKTLVDANGNPEKYRSGSMRFRNANPSALVAVKNGAVRKGQANDEATASGVRQTITLEPGETVSFINNDESGIYHDNNGSLTVKWFAVDQSTGSPNPGIEEAVFVVETEKYVRR